MSKRGSWRPQVSKERPLPEGSSLERRGRGYDERLCDDQLRTLFWMRISVVTRDLAYVVAPAIGDGVYRGVGPAAHGTRRSGKAT